MGFGTCPMPPEATDYDAKKGTAHTPMLWTALVCTIITFVSSVSLIILHLRRYRCPKEQRQIIRIVFAPFVFAIVSWLEVYDYSIAQYIDPIGEVYEAFCLCALYLLFIQFAAPAGTFGDDLFLAVKEAEEKASGFDWPRLTWIFVFQLPLTEILAVLILEVTEAANRYCLSSLSPAFGHFWVEIIKSVGLTFAVTALLRFYGRMKSLMKVRKGLAKFGLFKLIVFLHFVQAWIFSLLLDKHVIKPGSGFSYLDLLYGLPNVLTCAEMVIFSALFWYAYSSTEYSSSARPREGPLPLHKAVVDALNPYDLFHGIFQIFTIWSHMHRTGGFKEWRAANKKSSSSSRGGPLSAIGRKLGRKDRYQTIDGMESLSPPQAMHERSRSQPGTAYSGVAVENTELYQPPSASPPDPDAPRTHLMADTGLARSPSPSPQWNGQRYDRSPSPSGRYGGEEITEGRDMV